MNLLKFVDGLVVKHFTAFLVFMAGAVMALGGMATLQHWQHEAAVRSYDAQDSDPARYPRLTEQDVDNLLRLVGADPNSLWYRAYLRQTWNRVRDTTVPKSNRMALDWWEANRLSILSQFEIACAVRKLHVAEPDCTPVFSRGSWDTLYRMELKRCPEVGVLLESIWYEDYLNGKYDDYLREVDRLQLTADQQRKLFLHDSSELYAFREAIKQHPSCPKGYSVNPVGDAAVKSIMSSMGL